MPELLVTHKPYTFVPPHEGGIMPRILQPLIAAFRRGKFGVTEVEVRGAERLREAIDSDLGILLAPNHSRMSDAFVLQSLARELRQPFFTMASSHLFRGGKMLAWFLRMIGSFSVYREGVDRESVKAAIDILSEGRRPLVLFPEGALSQANDRLNPLMGGVSFIAGAAARQAQKAAAEDVPRRRVVTIPVAIKYLFQGDLVETVAPILSEIERRLDMPRGDDLPIYDRIYDVGVALLTSKEVELFGESKSGDVDERLGRLIDHLLVPLEEEWLQSARQGSVIARVKELRKAVLPEMIGDSLADAERDRRWKQLAFMDLAQQMSLYPKRYVASLPSVDRMLETVERFAEYVFGDEQMHGPMKAVVVVGNPVEVTPGRRGNRDQDPLLEEIERQLNEMLTGLSRESRMCDAHDGVHHG